MKNVQKKGIAYLTYSKLCSNKKKKSLRFQSIPLSKYSSLHLWL